MLGLDAVRDNAIFLYPTLSDYKFLFTDYIPAPNKSFLIIRQGQESDCTNITVLDDTFIEAVEEFNVTLLEISNTFGAGVNITRGLATVEIEDDDGTGFGGS